MKCVICGKEIEKGKRRKTCSPHCAWVLGKRTKRLNRKKKKRISSYRGYYHGIKCDSRWELAFLIYHLDKGRCIKRCDEVFEYMVRGKIHKYYPDFKCRKTIIEVKGKFRKNLKYKLQAVRDAGYKIILVDKEGIKPYLEYCYKKYKTEHLEKLYD